MAEAEERLTKRQDEQRRSILRKQEQLKERQKYLERVQRQQATNEKRRIDQIFFARAK